VILDKNFTKIAKNSIDHYSFDIFFKLNLHFWHHDSGKF